MERKGRRKKRICWRIPRISKTWRNNLNVINGFEAVEVNDCGTLFAITMFWEAYGINLFNMVQSLRNCTYSRKHYTQLATKEGEDNTSLITEDTTLKGIGTVGITEHPIGSDWTYIAGDITFVFIAVCAALMLLSCLSMCIVIRRARTLHLEDINFAVKNYASPD